ncbi:Zinc finger C3HC4 type (RING finger) family protein [Euphorbia peplus]|nr:Zinc finger C3HC4 type (RING finger) family protein [Euphorbia peplus]
MQTSNPSVSSPSSNSVDSSPLLLRSRRLFRRQPPHLRGAAARLLRQASGRRMMLRPPSVRVRENAAEQLEERQSDWAYSKPVVVLDVLWNLAFVGIAIGVLGLSIEEDPQVPLRLWIIGYGLQCVVHVVCVVFEYKRRRRRVDFGLEGSGVWGSGDSSSGSGSDGGDFMDYGAQLRGNDDDISVVKHLESANTMFSFLWWIIGFYWVTAGGQNVPSDSPQLYWLCITFLAFDVIFVIICVAVACLIGIAICCCLPCIIGILYAMSEPEGATKEEIDQLPKYKFRRVEDVEKADEEIQSSGGIMIECEIGTPTERHLSHEDAECCICLSAYEDGSELRELPCHHHFHSTCIERWLYINATCPLCKFNILKTSNHISGEEV